jgi:site-specific recombinase XerC
VGAELREGGLLAPRVRRERPSAVRNRDGVRMKRRDSVKSGRNEKRPGSAETLRGRHQEVSPDATPTLQAAARVLRDAVKNKGYRAFPLGQEAGAYLRGNRGRLLPNTYKTYESCLDKLARYFADKELLDFEPPMGTEWLEEFIDETWGEQSARTRAKNVSILKGFFEWAVLRGKLHGDPARPIRPPRKRGVERTTFSPDQERAIFAQNDRRDRLALHLLLKAGIRKGALQSVQFRHFDHAQRRLTVFTKGGTVQKVPIVDPAFWNELERHILDWEAQPNEYLLCREHTIPRWDSQQRKAQKLPPDRIDRVQYRDQPMGVHGLHNWWYRCLERAGVVAAGQRSGERMHKARHTAGQRVLDHTHGNLKAVQKLLGHSSISTTGDIYTDWDIDQLAETLRSMLEGSES